MHGTWKTFTPTGLAVAASALKDPGTLDVRKLWSVLLRRWRVILATSLTVSALAIFAILQITPVYTATTQLLIDPRKERVLGRSEAVVSELGFDVSAISTEVNLIRSFTIARRVVTRLRLDQNPSFTRVPAPSFLELLTASILQSVGAEAEPTPAIEPRRSETDEADVIPLSRAAIAAIKTVQRATNVRRVGATYFIEITYDDHDPKLAQQIANALAEAYLVEQLEARYQAANRAATWLNERVSAVRQQLELSELALVEHKSRHNIVGGQAGTIADQQAAAVNTQLVAARAETIQRKARFDQAQRILDGGAGIESVTTIMESPVIAALRTQDAAAARTEADLLTRYGPEHPNIVKIRAERNDIRRQIRSEVGRVVQSLKTDVEFALQKEKSLEQSLEELTATDTRSDNVVIRLRELEHQVQSNRLVYETLLTRFKEAEQQTSLQTAESRVVAPALVPALPSYPPKRPLLMVALVMGLGIGLGFAFVLEHLEDGFTTIEDVEAALHTPVLAMVPSIDERERTVDGRVLTIPEYVASKPLSRFSESIRSARVAAQMSSIDNPPRVIMVTSAVPSEGKTTMTLALAHSAAASGQRVLLIDCDLRHPSSSKFFGADKGPGLTDLLSGQAPPERVFLRPAQTGLTVIPAGTTTRHPPDVLGSERLKSLLTALRQSYDVVFVDAPPLCPVIDSSILSKLTDKVVFVVHWRSTPRQVVERAIGSNDHLRNKIAGVVLNNTQLNIAASYAPYYSYYHRKYQKYYQQ